MNNTKVLIVTMLLLCSISNVSSEEAWFEEGEHYTVEYDEGYDYYEWKSPLHPHWYDPLVKLVLKFVALFKRDIDMTVTHNITKESWDGDSYEPTGDESGFSWDLSFEDNQTTSMITTIDPVKEFFKDDMNRIDDFNTEEEYPDILNVTTTIDSAGTGLDKNDYGYTTVSENALREIEHTIEREEHGYYGFDMDSIAGEGGSGGISNTLGWGDMTSEGAEHKSVFEIFFYGLIPLLFILLVTKLMLRVNRG